MAWDAFLQVDPKVASGKAQLAGTDLTVESLLQLLAQGTDATQILAQHPKLTPEVFRAALAFAAHALGRQPIESIQPKFEAVSGRVYEVTNFVPVQYGAISYFVSATHPALTEDVWIKVFRGAPDNARGKNGFYAELKSLQGIRHPNILEIIDYGYGGEDNEVPFVVMPRCKGGNLRAWMKEGDFVQSNEMLETLDQIAMAIDFAHKQNRIHGDIKPENILFATEDRSAAVLSDFGTAKNFDFVDRVRQSGERSVRSASGAGEKLVGGTSAYLSPEQLDRARQTPASDIYSFALVAYELLTGALPFDLSAPLYRQFRTRVEGELIHPRQTNPLISEPVSDVLLQGLSVDPSRRHKSARAFCRTLRDANERDSGGLAVAQGKLGVEVTGSRTRPEAEEGSVRMAAKKDANVAIGFGLTFVVLMIAIAFLAKNPTTFQLFVFRVVLALAAAGVAAAIPGFFQLKSEFARNTIRAGGALGVFVLVYLVNPPALITKEAPDSVTFNLPREVSLSHAIELLTDLDNAVPRYDQGCTPAFLATSVRAGSMKAGSVTDLLNTLPQRLIQPPAGLRVRASRVEKEGRYDIYCSV